MHRIPQQRQVFVNFLDLGVDILGGIALRAHWREGKALQLGGPVGSCFGWLSRAQAATARRAIRIGKSRLLDGLIGHLSFWRCTGAPGGAKKGKQNDDKALTTKIRPKQPPGLGGGWSFRGRNPGGASGRIRSGTRSLFQRNNIHDRREKSQFSLRSGEFTFRRHRTPGPQSEVPLAPPAGPTRARLGAHSRWQ